MMWRYYELLTDVQVAEIEKMKREAHPMQAKKELARRIVGDFHGTEAAVKAGEDWAKQFQKSEVPEDVREVVVKLADIEWTISEDITVDSGISIAGIRQTHIKLDRLLVKCGLAGSTTDASRKIKSGAVRVGNDVAQLPRISFKFPVEGPMKLPLRVGKLIRIAVIEG
jgi:tyrosyl-tRNA synthetase